MVWSQYTEEANLINRDAHQISEEDDDLYKYGYNMDTAIIDYETKPFNSYSDIFNPYSYELY